MKKVTITGSDDILVVDEMIDIVKNINPIKKPCASVNFKCYKTECKRYVRTLIYHPSNSKKGFPIKGTNLRVSFEYI